VIYGIEVITNGNNEMSEILRSEVGKAWKTRDLMVASYPPR
jgi:hypothetical protein